MKTMSVSGFGLRIRSLLLRLRRDSSGLAATEFAMIVPIMLVMFFGTVEFSSGWAVNRKVGIVARTISDLTSRAQSVVDTDMSNFLAIGGAIMAPYATAPLHSTITEIYIDPKTYSPSTSLALVQWSKGFAPHGAGASLAIPAGLVSIDPTTKKAVAGQYLILSEVNYLYTPTIGYVMAKAGVTLREQTYTRPRLANCVLYNPTVPPPPCPTTGS
jgi:Flp pilus assembly protein TadG